MWIRPKQTHLKPNTFWLKLCILFPYIYLAKQTAPLCGQIAVLKLGATATNSFSFTPKQEKQLWLSCSTIGTVWPSAHNEHHTHLKNKFIKTILIKQQPFSFSVFPLSVSKKKPTESKKAQGKVKCIFWAHQFVPTKLLEQCSIQ